MLRRKIDKVFCDKKANTNLILFCPLRGGDSDRGGEIRKQFPSSRIPGLRFGAFTFYNIRGHSAL